MEDTKKTVEETPSSDASTVDYKAELDVANAQLAEKSKKLDQAEFKLKKKNIDEKKGKGKIFNKDDEEDEEDAPSGESTLSDEIDARVDARISKVTSVEFLSKHSINPDEIALAKFHLENTIKPSGNPEVDAMAALAIANQRTVLKQKEELKTALVNKNQQHITSTVPSNGAKIEVNEFGKYITPEQLTTLRTVHKFNDDQIRAFIQKKLGRAV